MSENDFANFALPYLDAILMMMFLLSLVGLLLLIVSVVLWYYCGIFTQAFSEDRTSVAD